NVLPIKTYFFTDDFPTTPTIEMHYRPLLLGPLSNLEFGQIEARLYNLSDPEPRRVVVRSMTEEEARILQESVLEELEIASFSPRRQRPFFSESDHLVLLFYNRV